MEEKRRIPYKWMALITICIASYMVTLDNSIVNISFPRLTRVFNTDASTVLWVSVAYLLVGVGLIFAFGKIGDTVGRKRIYVIGMTIFTIGMAFCAVSQTIVQLIAARVVQAIGSAMMMSLGGAIITAAFPAQERGKAIGIWGAMVSAGLLSGPVFGGILLDTLDWRSIFWVRIPVGIISITMGAWLLKEQKISGAKLRFDWQGALALFFGLTCLLLFFNIGGKNGFGSPLVLGLAGGAVALISLFIFIETRSQQPIIDLNLFRIRLFAAANTSLIINFLAVAANGLLMPFYLINALGYSSSKAGLLFAIVSATSLIIGPISGWLSDKIGFRVLCTTGIVLLSAGLFWLSRLDSSASVAEIIPRLLVMGIGNGLFSSPNNSSIMGSVPPDKLSTGSSMIASMRQIGMSSGTAIAGAIFTSRQAAHLLELTAQNPASDELKRMALVAGYQDTLLIGAIICAFAVIPSVMRGKPTPHLQPPHEAAR